MNFKELQKNEAIKLLNELASGEENIIEFNQENETVLWHSFNNKYVISYVLYGKEHFPFDSEDYWLLNQINLFDDLDSAKTAFSKLKKYN